MRFGLVVFPLVMVSKSTDMVQNFTYQQRWLMFLLHARTCCKAPGGECTDRNCVTVQELWSHMNTCVETQCVYPRCHPTKSLISHYNNCKDLRCFVCVPVKTYLQQQANAHAQARLGIESSEVNKALVSNDSASPHCPDTLGFLKLREYMRTLVFNMLQQHEPYPAGDALKAKYMEVARRLEEMLLKTAKTKDDYVNRSTLESRIKSLIKDRLKNYNQPHANSSSVGTMIPTSHVDDSPDLMGTVSAGASVGLGPSSNPVGPMDHDILKVREYMRTLVFNMLQKQNPTPGDDALNAKYLDVARILEQGLFKMAITKDDYLNQTTLESRLTCLIKGKKLYSYNHNQQNANFSPLGTMITTAPQVSAETTRDREKLLEIGDQLETEIAENLKSVSLYR